MALQGPQQMYPQHDQCVPACPGVLKNSIELASGVSGQAARINPGAQLGGF